jgi:hypothetical protein
MSIAEGKYLKQAAIQRGLASCQATLDEIQKKCQRDKSSLLTEYWALMKTAQKLSNNWTELPEDTQSFKNVLLRLKEILRTIIVLDEAHDGAKYSWDSDGLTQGEQAAEGTPDDTSDTEPSLK